MVRCWHGNVVRALALAMTIFCFGSAHQALAQGTATEDGAAATEDLPGGKEIYDAYIEATGGRERFQELNSSRIVGAMKMQGMEAPMEILRERPGKLVVTIEFEGFGTISQGINETHAWDVNPMRGARLLDGKERDDMQKRADFEEELEPEKYYKSIETVGKESIDGKECYVVEFTSNNDEVEKRFFDVATDFVVRVETKRDTPLGKMNVATAMSDYRDIDGIKMPFKTEMSVMGQSQVIEFQEVNLNVEHEEDAFNPPEAVAKLIDKQKAADAEEE